MHRVPRLQQPSRTSCFPTCVQAVLAHNGLELSHDDLTHACGTTPRGTVADLALRELADAGIDVTLHQFHTIDELAEVLTESGPVIVFLFRPGGGTHAVVACGVGPDGVTVMDPAVGDYTAISMTDFEAAWDPMANEGMTIGRSAIG